MAKRLVVIGGGAAGMSAASAARRVDSALEIVVLEAAGWAAYGMCGLPYYLGGDVDRPEDLLAYPPAYFVEKRRIDLRLNTRATRLDANARIVGLSHDGGPEEELTYDSLIVTAGGTPTRPPTVGLEDPRVFTVRAMEDAIRLRGLLDEGAIRTAVVVGGGYIGLEMADVLVSRGVAVTLVEMAPGVLPTFDASVADLVEDEIRRHDVDLRLGVAVSGVVRAGDFLEVSVGNEVLPVDAVVVASGVRPASTLPAGQGAATDATGALLVDECMRTSLPGVFAAGDCVALHHLVLDRPLFVPLGPAANKTGRVAGTVAAGGQARFGGIVGTAVVKVFDLAVARTGLTLAEARSEGIDAIATDALGRSRAKYYPGAEAVHVRLVHTPGGRLLGAQLVGRGDGIAKRVDVLAVALHAGFDIDDLAGLDLSYAPPYAPVYEAVLLAAQAAQRSLAPQGRGTGA